MTLMAAILGRALVQAKAKPEEESLSTAVRTTFASCKCEHEEQGEVCGILAWVVLGDDDEDMGFCFDHASEALSRRVRKLLNGGRESK